MDNKTGRSITYAVHEFKPQISTHLARSSSIKNAVHLNKDYNFNRLKFTVKFKLSMNFH